MENTIIHDLGSALEYALSPGIIACVAGIWSPGNQYCLPLHTAANVIRESGCRVIVVHTPNLSYPEMLKNDVLGIDELIQETKLLMNELVLFFNTSLCSTLADVQQTVETMKFVYTSPLYKNAIAAFLKLEILDKHLRPLDEDVCKVLDDLSQETCKICLPFLRGESGCVEYAISRGCPAIRIWCSDIGKSLGITDKERLRRIIESTTIPLILEGGISKAIDVKNALEMGFKAVLMNSAFRYSEEPIKLAREIRAAIDSARGI